MLNVLTIDYYNVDIRTYDRQTIGQKAIVFQLYTIRLQRVDVVNKLPQITTICSFSTFLAQNMPKHQIEGAVLSSVL